MKKKNKKYENSDFFMETIDLTPSNNIQQSSPNDYNLPQMHQQEIGHSEMIYEDRKKRRFISKIKKNALKIFLITLCAYMAFLIFGALKTNYYNDSNGVRQPIFVTYQDVADKNDYNILKEEFTTMRNILIDIRTIEIKFHNEEINAYDAASQYSKQLEKIDVVIPKLKAIDVGSSQEVIKNALTQCYTSYLAGYLQDIINGLSTNDVALQNTALQKRELALKSYFAAQDEFQNLAKELKLDDNFFDFDLDKEVAKKDPTAVVKGK